MLDLGWNVTHDCLIGINFIPLEVAVLYIQRHSLYIVKKYREYGKRRGIKADPLTILASKQRLKSDTASQPVIFWRFPISVILYDTRFIEKKVGKKRNRWKTVRSLFRWELVVETIENYATRNCYNLSFSFD